MAGITSREMCIRDREKGMNVTAIGKIEDIFEHRGMTRTDHTTNNNDGIEKTILYTKEEFEGILFTNLVDTDMIYGHRTVSYTHLADDIALPYSQVIIRQK